MREGLMAEFETPEGMLAAIHALRERGYTRLDAFTPYPVHGLEQALRLPRSRLTWIVFPFAAAGAGLGYFIQWYTNAFDYPLDVGGRPPHAAPMFVPIAFETLVLVSALSGFVIFLVLTRLPQLWNPVFEVEGFERASIDRFWVAVDARDPALLQQDAERALADLGATRVAWARPGAAGPAGEQHA